MLYGTSYLLDGFKLLSENKSDVQLLILSDGPLRKDIDVFIDKYNLHDKIAVIGKVPNLSMPDYLNASDVYISVLLSDGTSLSLLEAIACGSGGWYLTYPAIRE